MSTSIIDGTVEEADLTTDRAGIKVFKTVRFRLADGSERTLTKTVTSKSVGDELVAGRKGRFYLYNAFDFKGVHGARTIEGHEVHGFPGNNQRIFLMLGIVSVLWIAVRVFGFGDVPVFGVVFLIFAAVCWYLFSKGKREALAQFEGDAGYRAAG